MKNITGETLVKSSTSYTSKLAEKSQWESKVYKEVAFVPQMLGKSDDNNAERLQNSNYFFKKFQSKNKNFNVIGESILLRLCF